MLTIYTIKYWILPTSFFSAPLNYIYIYNFLCLCFSAVDFPLPPKITGTPRRWRRESLAEDLRRLAEAKRRVRREEAEEAPQYSTAYGAD